MAWIGVALVLVGGVLVYSSYKNLSPWQEFLDVLKTGKTTAGTSVAGGAPAKGATVA